MPLPGGAGSPRIDSRMLPTAATVDASKLPAHTFLAETLAQPSSGGPQPQSHAVSVSVREAPVAAVAAASARTTVLPRIEMNGSDAELVFDGKERFERLRLLGEGGLGEVIGVMDHDIGRKVAIKRLRTEVKSPAALARFVDEIRTIGKLEHPNIIPIHDVGMDQDGELYFVMKYVDGETLESVIERLAAGDVQYHQHYTFERRVEIFRALLEALAFAHDKGIVHRDIKPANIMIGKFGEVLLMDWGIAKSLKSDLPELPMVDGGVPSSPAGTGRAFQTQLGALVGTPLYMSPEQASGKATDERSDVYSLCLVFYELLYLRHPLAHKTTIEEVLEAARTEAFELSERASAHQSVVPSELMWFLRHGLAKDPALRHPSMRAMIDLLDRRADGHIRVECAVTLAKSATLRSSKFIDAHPFAFLGLASASLVFFIALVVLAVRGIA